MPAQALVVLRSEHETHTPEAELVTVERRGDRVVIVLDDLATIDFAAAELLAALGQGRGEGRVAA